MRAACSALLGPREETISEEDIVGTKPHVLKAFEVKGYFLRRPRISSTEPASRAIAAMPNEGSISGTGGGGGGGPAHKEAGFPMFRYFA
jgi:hypothetical protein